MKVVFLDRDGVINRYPGDNKYVTSWRNFKFLPRVLCALARLKRAGCKIFIISNQAGVSKGIFSSQELNKITINMLKHIRDKGGYVDGVYYCPHRDEDSCSCRKPKTGLIKKALRQLQSQKLKTQNQKRFFIGDTIRDIRTGKACGCRTILVFSGKEKSRNKCSWPIQPDFTASDLYEATQLILKERSAR
jgi:histidinol-phosphate phosphatase family protein